MSAVPDDIDTRTARLTALLEAAEDAHGVYETTELDGVYDEAWASWYARYARDNGVGAILGRELSLAELETYLVTSFAEFKRVPPGPESWAVYTARRIAEEL